MTIKNFIELYEAGSSVEECEAVVNEIIKTKYISLAGKMHEAQKIVETNNFVNGELRGNSVGEYLAYVISALRMYTILEFKFEDSVAVYDALQSCDLIKHIFNATGDDLQEYKLVLNMCRDDFNKNNYSTHAYVGRATKQLSKTIVSCFSILEKILNNMDIEKVKEYLEKQKTNK